MNIVWHGVAQEGDFEDDGTVADRGYTTDTLLPWLVQAKVSLSRRMISIYLSSNGISFLI